MRKEFVAPLAKTEGPSSPLEITSMDFTGPYLVTPRKNKYLLNFIDHFSKWVEAYLVPDITAETCARVYSFQILTQHGTGSTLITEEGISFMSTFLRKRAKYWESEK